MSHYHAPTTSNPSGETERTQLAVHMRKGPPQKKVYEWPFQLWPHCPWDGDADSALSVGHLHSDETFNLVITDDAMAP